MVNVPRVVGQEISETGEVVAGGAAGIVLDYVTIENIFPLSWENGVIRECAFSSAVARDGKDYLYLQIHKKENDDTYTVENRIYRYDNDVLTEEKLSNVSGFERIPPMIRTGSKRRQFVIDRPNIANNVDYRLPVGIAVFANAIDALRGVDSAYDCYVNEFENGPMLLAVKMPATNWEDGAPTIDAGDRRFYILPEDAEQGNVIEPISPPLRTEKLNVGLQEMLSRLSSRNASENTILL